MPEYENNTTLPAGRATWQDVLHAAAPALLYTVLSSVVYSLTAVLLPGLPKIMLQAAALSACLAYFGWQAWRERLCITGWKGTVYRYPASFCFTAAAVMCSVACNYLLVLTGLADSSAGYQRVSRIFYGNGLLAEILTLCVIGPLVEELVYRGFVFQRLRRKCGAAPAAVLSAVLFGVLHLNLVQGIYASVLGILLAYIVYKTDSLVTAAAAHMASNLASVLWTETDWLDFLNQDGSRMYAALVLCAVLAGIFLNYGNQLVQRCRVNGEYSA